MGSSSGATVLPDAARRAATVAAERADASETARALDGAVVTALVEGGLMRLPVPAAYGGPEADPLAMVDALATVAAGDGAAGWCAMIASTTASMAWFADPGFAREAYGDPTSITGGAIAPNGVGTTVDDGYRVTGRWQWGSGTAHCRWILGGTLTDDGAYLLAYAPAEQVELLDTWWSSGLRGTGSGDVAFHDVLVPRQRCVHPLGATPTIDGDLGRFPVFGLLAASIASVAVGIARHAVEAVVDQAGGKTPMFSSSTLAASALAQHDVAAAEAAVGAGWAFLTDELAMCWALVQAGDDVPVERRARLRLAAVHATREAARTVDLAYETGGGSSVFAANPLQRCFRDVHTATQHLMVSPRVLETVGRIRLGQDVDLSLF
ncbi:MAG: acyl-CoA dehydrogenase family protein [Acidimicrobiales bacterium]